MNKWYKFSPVDTLFFRGAEPMAMGENHTVSSIFPPPAHTLSGALRTTVLKNHKISFDDYGNGKVPKEITEAIGEAGSDAPFNIFGPLFMQNENLYVPAPYCWFTDKSALEKNEAVPVYRGKLITPSLVKTEHPNLLWAKGIDSELISIGGNWIQFSDIGSGFSSLQVKKTEDFFVTEQRTGIALHHNRRVRKGHLYSFNHARLTDNVSLVFAVDKSLSIPDEGVLSLGAEQRFGTYQTINEFPFQDDVKTDFYMSLSILLASEEVNSSIIATGKVQYLGGWDLNRGFHKPMKGFFPAGTVCNKKINSNFIAIKGESLC